MPSAAHVRLLGHRGAPRVAQENTIAAFRAAARQGADGVELDVRRTADGVLVVHHDAVVAELGALCDLPVGALPPWIPTLSEALEACADMAMVNIEIKNSPADPDFDGGRAVATAVGDMVADRPGPRLLASSFDLLSIDAARRAAPDLATGWLTVAGYDQVAAIETVVSSGHSALHPQESSVTAELIALTHERGLELMAWTVDDPDRAVELAHLGVDGIITNVPDLLLVALARSGPRRP